MSKDENQVQRKISPNNQNEDYKSTKTVNHGNHPEDNKNKDEEIKMIPIISLYRFCQGTDYILLFFGILGALGMGVSGAIIGVVFSDAVYGFKSSNSHDDVVDEVGRQCLGFIYVGLANLASSALCEGCWSAIGERLGIRIRIYYLEAIMKKSVSWFDVNKPQELPAKISEAVNKFQSGVGEKVGKLIFAFSMTLSGIIVAFIFGWQLALILLGVWPITFLAARMIGYATTTNLESVKSSYLTCGGYVDEVLSEIRTVYAFCAEDYEKKKYLDELGKPQESMVKSSLIMGLSVGLVYSASELFYGIGFFVGSHLIQNAVWNYYRGEPYNCSSVLTVFFGAFFSMISLGMLAPHLGAIREAQIAAYEMYELIDSVKQDGKEEEGNVIIPPDKFKGRIEFKNVSFSYPSQPEIKVLKNFNMIFEPGQMYGICGKTGSGKSTIVQLIERFYKAESGIIEVDGVDINTLNLKWWRNTIGYVGQEPVLFNTSIKSNIEYGKEGATMQEIEKAAEQAYCLDFIKEQTDKFDTIVGSEGSQMSGGQKQRIAIARALIKAPRIMLLDEASSALDLVSEQKVQTSLNKLQEENKMTLIVVAHKLITIKKADKILVLSEGELKEEGTDQQLRSQNTIYAEQCKLQDVEDSTQQVKISEEKKEIELGNAAQTKVTTEDKKQDNKKDVEMSEEKKKEEEEKKAALEQKYRDQLSEETKDYKFPLFIAFLLSFISGYHMPVAGMLFGMGSMDLLEPDPDELRRKIDLNFIGYAVCAGGIIILMTLVFWIFGYVASKVTYSLRQKLYGHLLKMDMSFYDDTKNSAYNLNNILGEGTEHINGFMRTGLGISVESLSYLLIAIAIGFGFSWRMTLIIFACIPFMIMVGVVMSQFQAGFAEQSSTLYLSAMNILSEAVKNFRTVSSFCSEKKIVTLFQVALEEPLKSISSKCATIGLLFGVTELIPNLVYGGLFYFCALFQLKYGENPRNAFVAVYALIYGATALGQIQQFAPDMAKANTSLNSIYGIINNSPSIAGQQGKSMEVKGRIEFRNVSFKYPSRDKQVFKDVSMVIEPGQRVAIVGPSGSGKSTIIQLIERFYDPISGSILVDGENIKAYDIRCLRSSIGLVSQEPILFDTTIEENIKYGNQSATDAEVEEACIMADVVPILQKSEVGQDSTGEPKKGLKRKVGAKGKSLSGGEKQRLAIARAIIKKPKVLIFDEATSELDTATEKQIQAAINKISEGKTFIVIAHRLSTILDDDTIFMIEDGNIVESGKKKELIEKRGNFYKLYETAIKKEK